MKVDFHCHTRASDGTLSPPQLIDLAVEKQIDWLAITDHDTTAGYQQAKEYAREKGIKLTPGVEISASWQGRTVHIVALDVRVDEPALQALLAHIRQLRWQRVAQINDKLKKRGHACMMNELLDQVGVGVVARPHVAQILVSRKYVQTISQAFDKFLKSGRVGYVKVEWPSLTEVVSVIRQCGGIAIMAHPGAYQLTSRKLNSLLSDFAQTGGQGIEVIVSPNRTSEAMGMADRAKRYGFYASLGSDFHSPEHRWRNLGWLAPLPDGLMPIYDALSVPKT
ncbi:MAG: PHP domain-containing protein [Thiomicrospira sp.]|jgi:predicted metal-dependent phosphoesterase TrpH